MSGESINITRFLITISLLLFTAKALGELFTRIRQPAIMGEIIAGLILGPTVIGTFFPSFHQWLFPDGGIVTSIEGLITLAVVLLLLVSGLEVDLTIALRQGKTAILISSLGVIIPFSLGVVAVYAFPGLFEHNSSHPRMLFALFIGIAISISALPVIAKILMDIGIFRTEIGSVIISAAMFNDVIGWLIFSIILGNLGTAHNPFNFATTLILTLSFAFIAVVFLRKLINRIIPYIQNKISYPGGMLGFIFILGLLGAAFTQYIGIHAIFGSFIIGIAIGNSVHLKEEIRENINQFVTNLFAPLFFVSIGLRVNFWTHFDLPLVIIIMVLAFTGKVAGCGLGAYLGGMNKNDSLAVGFGMISTGAMGIILGLIALESGLITEKLYVALVIMAVTTSVSSAPLMNYFINRKKITFTGILRPELVFFTDFSTKEEAIRHLVDSTAAVHKLDKKDVLNDVLKRENESSTGIANYLALPHGRIKFNKPVAAAAINSRGIEFGALDGEKSRIIILLLTPKNKNEMQLKLLSEIGQKFRSQDISNEYLSAETPREFIKLLNRE